MEQIDLSISKIKPYPYQVEGINIASNFKRLIIGDKMGLGKTGQAILTITAAKSFPCIVVCPSSLKINWQREWKKWVNIDAVILNDKNRYTWGGMASGMNLFDMKHKVFICNYESLQKFFVNKINKNNKGNFRLKDIVFNPDIKLFKSIIIDESHRIKEPTTNQTRFCAGIAHDKEYRIALTGTPLVNRVKDLASQLFVIGQINQFGGYNKFIKQYCGENPDLKELQEKLKSSCYFKREKKDVLKDLPDLQRIVVQCEISKEIRKEYITARNDLKGYLKEYTDKTAKEINKSMRGEIMVKIGILKNIAARGKMQSVIDYVSDVIAQNEKIILFIHQKQIALVLQEKFPTFVTVTGKDNQRVRQKNIDSFQNNPDILGIICSMKAAGVGLTLTAARVVAHVELPWHDADASQAEARAHRIGQKNSVLSEFFLAENTIDQWIYFDVIQRKKELAKQVTGTEFDIDETIFNEEIHNLMRYLESEDN